MGCYRIWELSGRRGGGSIKQSQSSPCTAIHQREHSPSCSDRPELKVGHQSINKNDGGESLTDG